MRLVEFDSVNISVNIYVDSTMNVYFEQCCIVSCLVTIYVVFSVAK